jgi:putative glutamine amidotransferase
MRPLIGISCSVVQRNEPLRPLFAVSQSYALAVERAGGIPVLVPPQGDAQALRELYDRLDGVLFSGGGDIDPARYGEELLPDCGAIEPLRDELEIELARIALDGGKPIFGICRGMQLLNVATGGSLYQDITAQRPDAPPHKTSDYQGKRDLTSHSITIQSRTPLADILGATTHPVNSFHHQAVKQPGSGVELVAWSEDGIAEGMVIPGHPFALAVQFHPEELTLVDPASQRLFDAFVQACAERMRASVEPVSTTARPGA